MGRYHRNVSYYTVKQECFSMSRDKDIYYANVIWLNALELMSHDDKHSALRRLIFQWKAEELSAFFYIR